MHKKITTAVLAVFVLSFFVLAAGCGGGSQMLQVNGSSTVTPVAQAWAESFQEKYPDKQVAVTGSGSGNGIAALINGTTDIAMSSRKMTPEERDKMPGTPKEFVIARDGMAIVVNPDNPVDTLTMEQIKGIFTGEITNWKEVGGSDEEILVYTRDTSSGTYIFFKEFVLDNEEYANNARSTSSNSNLAESVSQEDNAVGYVGMAFVDDSVKALSVVQEEGGDPVKPTLETAKQGMYPIVRDMNMYTIGEPEGLAREYLEFGMSPEGQSIVQEVGYVPVK